MIEFKQIIGRGTRLHDGKDYFTIYDFVRAYEHFHDEGWDGKPVEPEPPTPNLPGHPPSRPTTLNRQENHHPGWKRSKSNSLMAKNA